MPSACWRTRTRRCIGPRPRAAAAASVTETPDTAPAPDAAEAVLYRALDRGLCFKITMGNVLTLTPPLITNRDQMDRALDIVESCIAEVEREAPGHP